MPAEILYSRGSEEYSAYRSVCLHMSIIDCTVVLGRRTARRAVVLLERTAMPLGVADLQSLSYSGDPRRKRLFAHIAATTPSKDGIKMVITMNN